MSFFHLTVASPDLHAALSKHDITAIAYEVMQEEDGMLPMLMPMSEVAGRLAPIFAGQLLTIPREAVASCWAACRGWPTAL